MRRNEVKSLINCGICVGLIDSIRLIDNPSACKNWLYRLEKAHGNITSKVVRLNFDDYLIRMTGFPTFDGLRKHISKLIMERHLKKIHLKKIKEIFSKIFIRIDVDLGGGCFYADLFEFFVDGNKKEVLKDIQERVNRNKKNPDFMVR